MGKIKSNTIRCTREAVVKPNECKMIAYMTLHYQYVCHPKHPAGSSVS